jgi:hypothetical protein
VLLLQLPVHDDVRAGRAHVPAAARAGAVVAQELRLDADGKDWSLRMVATGWQCSMIPLFIRPQAGPPFTCFSLR